MRNSRIKGVVCCRWIHIHIQILVLVIESIQVGFVSLDSLRFVSFQFSFSFRLDLISFQFLIDSLQLVLSQFIRFVLLRFFDNSFVRSWSIRICFNKLTRHPIVDLVNWYRSSITVQLLYFRFWIYCTRRQKQPYCGRSYCDVRFIQDCFVNSLHYVVFYCFVGLNWF